MIIIYYVDVFFQIKKKHVFNSNESCNRVSRIWIYTNHHPEEHRVFIIAKTGPSSVDAATCLFDFLGDVTADVDVKRFSVQLRWKSIMSF